MSTSEEIIIIGAGAAGLMAARELSSQYKVTVLEARADTGGRMHTSYRPDGTKAAETGAEFVHGELPITLSILKDAGLAYHLIGGNMYYVHDGQWHPQREMADGWDEMVEQMGRIEEDMTMQAFLNKYYSGDEYIELRENAAGFIHGFDLADEHTVSVKYLYNEWINESDKNFRIDKGYSAMVSFMVSDCESRQCTFITDAPVTRVEWSAAQATVHTADGTTYKAAKVIITVPLGVLQEQAITFSPAIPDYIAAANDIGWGTVIKTVLHFQQPFWEKHAKQVSFILSEAPIPTWWPQSDGRSYALTGWLGGPPAVAYLQYSNEQIVALALTSLSLLTGESTDHLRTLLTGHYISNWAADPYVRGSYSYGTPATQQAQALLNTPVADTLYFAGEALYNGASPGTVEAALVTGKAVADKIKSS